MKAYNKRIKAFWKEWNNLVLGENDSTYEYLHKILDKHNIKFEDYSECVRRGEMK